MQTRFLLLLRVLLGISDLVLVNMCLFIGYFLSNKYGNHINIGIYLNNIMPSSIIWALSTLILGLYTEYTIYKIKDIRRSTWRSIVLHLVLFLTYIAITGHDRFPVVFMISFYLLLIVSFVISRLTCILFEGKLNFNFDNRKAAILAIASIGGHWIQLLRLSPLFSGHDMTFISTKQSLVDMVKGQKYHAVPDSNKDSKFNLFICCLSVFWYILVSRPRVVITTGAAPGLIGIFIGKLFGAKTIWIDSIANVEKLSLSGSIAVKFADRVYTQWDHLATPAVIFSGNIFE